MGLFSKISNGLKNTRSSFLNALGSMLGGFTKIDDELFDELEEILVMADVGVHTAGEICSKLRERVKQEKITDPALIKGMLKTIVCEMVSGGEEIHHCG